MKSAPDRQLDLIDAQPWMVLQKPFRMPYSIVHSGETYWYPRLLSNGAIQVIGQAGTQFAGMVSVFPARECFVEGTSLLDLGREHAMVTMPVRKRLAALGFDFGEDSDCCQ